MDSTHRPAVIRWLGGLIFAILFTVPAHAAVDRPHALTFKIGYHLYPSSSYFEFSDSLGLGGTDQLSGQSLEFIDYTYQWRPRWGLNVTLYGAYFRKYTPASDFQQSLVTSYHTIMPVYTLWGQRKPQSWLVYTGVGIGSYGLTLRVDFPGVTDEFNNHTYGYVALLGAEYRVSDQVGFLIEEKYARARMGFGRDFGADPTSRALRIDLGGHNLLVGVRFHF
jgi:opacity protein-like surface antigen